MHLFECDLPFCNRVSPHGFCRLVLTYVKEEGEKPDFCNGHSPAVTITFVCPSERREVSDLSLSNFKDVILRETGPNDRVSVFETCKGGGLKGSGTFSEETASMSAGSLGCPVCSSLCASLEVGSSCGSSASQVLGCQCASLTPFSYHNNWEGVE